MEKLKKISLVITMLMLLGCMFISKSYAEIKCNVSLFASNSEIVSPGDELSIYAKISNVEATKGIIAIGGVIDYDKDSLTLVSVTGENGWSNPFYNESNGKITTVKNDFAKADEVVIKMTFRVNGNASNNAWISLDNVQISDGNEENNIGGNAITISIRAKNTSTPTQPENPSNPTTPTNQTTPTNSTTPGNSSSGNTTPSNPRKGTYKPGTNNGSTGNETENNTEDNTNEKNETNTNENISENKNIDIEINENFNIRKEDDIKNTNKNSEKTKRVTYAICIGGIIIATVIMFCIVKSSGKEE